MMKTMSLIVNARFLTQNITGVQRFATEICQRLQTLLDNVEFVTPRHVVQHDAFIRLGAKAIGTHSGHLWEQWDLPKYLSSRGNPLLLNLANTAPVFYRNQIVTIHDVAYKVYPQTYPKTFLLFYENLVPRLLQNSKRIVTVSEFSKSEICKYYSVSESKVSVVYNAVSEKFLGDPQAEVSEYFLVVSSMNYRKNFHYVLKAFIEYQKRGGQCALYIIGDLKNRTFKNVDLSIYENSTQIKFLGRVSDEELVTYYRRAKAFIYPSIYEGFGIPPLEAQACGCPAICALSSCLPEIFGDSVLYCDPYNIDTLVKSLFTLEKDETLREELIKKGRKNFTKYSWEKSAEGICHIIKELT